MRTWVGAVIVFVIGLGAYLRGAQLGAADQRERDAVALSRLRVMYERELEVADDNWVDCILREHIRYPADTAHQAI